LDSHRLHVCADSTELARVAAKHLIEQSNAAVAERNSFTLALSGGSTPKHLYELLADPSQPFFHQLPWNKTQFFWTDERYVSPDHPDSNYRMVNEAMLLHVPVPKENVHRFESEFPIAIDVAKQYEKTLKNVFHLTPGAVPRFDVILLGLGSDGHTASLFPGSDVIHERQHLVASPWVERLNSYRVTLTLPVLNAAVFVLFLVSGNEKAEILSTVLRSEYDPERLPAQAVEPDNGFLLWLVDQPAARLLDQ
jgi:6-phosphogluconolactonase